MKRYLSMLMISCLSFCYTKAQSRDSLKHGSTGYGDRGLQGDRTAYPEFPGGKSAMKQFIAENLRYPKDAFKQKIEGKVILGFSIEKDGMLTDIHVLKSDDQSLNNEAIRIIKLMPKWKPGKNFSGQEYRYKYKLDIIFKLPIQESPSSK